MSTENEPHEKGRMKLLTVIGDWWERGHESGRVDFDELLNLIDAERATRQVAAPEPTFRAHKVHRGAPCWCESDPEWVAARAAAQGPEQARREAFEQGRATGTVEGWADYTASEEHEGRCSPDDPCNRCLGSAAVQHDDEYDALARQLHESIAEGQTVALTAKALRILGGPEQARCKGVCEYSDEPHYHGPEQAREDAHLRGDHELWPGEGD